MSISLHFDLTILLSKGIYKNTQEQWTSELKMIQVYFYSKRRSLNRDIDFLAFIQYCTENGPDLAIPSGDMEAVITVMVPIDFSGITCISKGFQDVTQCPISSKTKCTWVSVPLRSAGCSFPSCPIFILWFYSCLFILHIFFFCPTEPHHYVKSTSPPAFLSGFFHLSSVSNECSQSRWRINVECGAKCTEQSWLDLATFSITEQKFWSPAAQ